MLNASHASGIGNNFEESCGGAGPEECEVGLSDPIVNGVGGLSPGESTSCTGVDGDAGRAGTGGYRWR